MGGMSDKVTVVGPEDKEGLQQQPRTHYVDVICGIGNYHLAEAQLMKFQNLGNWTFSWLYYMKWNPQF